MDPLSRALEPEVEKILADAGCGRAVSVEVVQSLWSGYGQIVRVRLDGAGPSSVIVKRVRWPTRAHHPRGWTTSRSHERKVRSYAVEARFYADYAPACGAACRVPRALASAPADDGVLLVLEDLDAAGLDQRRGDPSARELRGCLEWLAAFHATFLGRSPEGLWQTGTYWHLETRPDELAAIAGTPLAAAAPALDEELRASPFQTLVHGDAKIANFCFGPAGVAAVDFQYVGGGPGVKDLAYFLGSCLDERECERREEELLELYFAALAREVRARHPEVDAGALCRDWRALYPVAWTDFYRFLAGWSPGHWKVHAYTRRLAAEVLETL